MKRIVVAITLALLTQTLSAQDWAKARLEKSSRHGEWVEFKSGERTIKAFVVYPERKEKTPVVLVIHETLAKYAKANVKLRIRYSKHMFMKPVKF